jgi:hypothetical protein
MQLLKTAFYWSIIILITLQSGCSKEDESYSFNFISAQDKYINLNPLGDSISITTLEDNDVIWEYSFENEVDWLTVHRNHNLLTLIAQPNNKTTNRSAKIFISANNIITDEIYIRQERNTYYTITVNDINFDKSTGTILCSEDGSSCYFGSATDIIIPETIDGVEVKHIGDNAFENNVSHGTRLTKVIIPNTVITIGESSFESNAIETVKLSDSITVIKTDAFAHNHITNLNLSNKITVIENGAFNGNEISELIIPESVHTLGDYSFSYNELSQIEIPKSVKSIGKYAFYHNQLKSVNLSESLFYIGSGAFNYNEIEEVNGTQSNGLFFKRNDNGTINKKHIVSYGGTADIIDFIPEGVEIIGQGAFSSSYATSIIIPEGVTHLEEQAFFLNSFESIILPSSIIYIGSMVFSYNNFLNNIQFSENSQLIYISGGAFFSCSELIEFELPSNANPDFYSYKSSSGIIYSEGDIIYLTICSNCSYYSIDKNGNILEY